MEDDTKLGEIKNIEFEIDRLEKYINEIANQIQGYQEDVKTFKDEKSKEATYAKISNARED